MTAPDSALIATHYAEARVRLGSVLRSLEDHEWATPVPACPGWSVHDVLAHLVGVIEDATAGLISGPPDDAQTADEVHRHRGDDSLELLDTWDSLAPGFESDAAALGIWPAMFDVLSHEHDIRSAVGRPGARDSDGVRLAADLLLRWCRASQPIEIRLDGDRPATVRSHDGGSRPAELTLSTTSFEVLRFRLGRRSPQQVAALDWSADPDPVIDELFIFGPAEHDLVE